MNVLPLRNAIQSSTFGDTYLRQPTNNESVSGFAAGPPVDGALGMQRKTEPLAATPSTGLGGGATSTSQRPYDASGMFQAAMRSSAALGQSILPSAMQRRYQP